MAKLDRVQVGHVARLAKLPVSSGELSKFGEQLGKIVEYVGKIAELKTSAFAKASADKQNSKVLREDTIGEECLTQEEATGGAKSVHNGLFVAEAVFGD